MAQNVLNHNLIEQTIKNHIHEQTSVFVFPTQTAADLWADRATNPAVTDVSAVAMDRFIAWDSFKGTSIKTKQKDKKSVPSSMRKIFASNIISENAKAPFFKTIIPPKYAASAEGFLNWLSSLLPSLSVWKAHFESSLQAGNKKDDEDDDLLLLYNRYKAFLDEHNLFDPAWEKPPFISDGNHYFVFFPEIYSDYTEYKPLLENSPEDITLIHLSEDDETQASPDAESSESASSANASTTAPSVDFFNNSRTEIKAVALHLRKLHTEDNIPWNDICISIPDFDSYGPYIDRELTLYQIPHVMKNARSLSSSGGGSLFSQIASCVSSDFSYESLKTLLLNKELPWKEPTLNNELLQFGQANNCICSFMYEGNKVDVWEKSFADRGASVNLINYYKSLKRTLTDLINSSSFEKTREHYFNFRETFFNMDECPEHTDRLISRCIAELGGLIDLELEYPECKAPSPFSFFVSSLEDVNYLAQTENLGVQLLPYKAAACAPFAAHIILDSSQSSLAVIYKQLSFLREDKRKRFLGGKDDPNVTDLFIRLYNMNSTEAQCYFTAASKTFSGYAQASSYLSENDYTKTDAASLFTQDPYKTERTWLLSDLSQKSPGQNSSAQKSPEQKSLEPAEITQLQKDSFISWKNSSRSVKATSSSITKETMEKLKQQLQEKRYKEGNIKISTTHLKSFFGCQRLWFLQNVIDLKEISNEAELMNPFALGELYHRILELFCKELIKSGQQLHLENEELTEAHHELVLKCIDDAINEKDKNSFLARQLLQTTKEALTSVMLETVKAFSEMFEGCTIYASELWLEYELREKNILCQGKIDCVLQEPGDGTFILVDFKSSDSSIPKNLYYEEPEPGQKEELPDFQMPMYIYLLKNQTKPIEVERCCFFNVSKAEQHDVNLEELKSSSQKLLECIDLYAEQVSTGDFLNNSQTEFAKCNGCAYRAICRKVFVVGKGE